MRTLELLAPARNIEIGIAAIDCGADAVYIAGPAFGARQAAGNSIEDISRLCEYAHRFGARIFLTLNTILYDEELQEAEELMLKAEQAGVDAIIVQDLAIMKMADGGTDGKTLGIPLHASTQCAIRDVDKAMFYRQSGFSRLVLERELPLETDQENQRKHRMRNRVFRTRRTLRMLQRTMLYVRIYFRKKRKQGRMHPGLQVTLRPY